MHAYKGERKPAEHTKHMPGPGRARGPSRLRLLSPASMRSVQQQLENTPFSLPYDCPYPFMMCCSAVLSCLGEIRSTHASLHHSMCFRFPSLSTVSSFIISNRFKCSNANWYTVFFESLKRTFISLLATLFQLRQLTVRCIPIFAITSVNLRFVLQLAKWTQTNM